MDVPLPPTSGGAAFCPQCGAAVPPDAHFCPRCGKELSEPPFSMSIIGQVGLYALSIFLPPLGLWPGIKYARKKDPTARRIGWIAIALTIASTVVTLWLTSYFFNIYLNTLTQGLNGF